MKEMNLFFRTIIISCAIILILPLWCFVEAATAPDTAIVIIEWRGETDAERGFKDELKKLKINTEIIAFDADQDQGKLLQYINNDFVKIANRINYVYSFGTSASWIVKRTLPEIKAKRIVHVSNIIADPLASKFADSMALAGENRIVGCHVVSLETQLKNAFKVRKFQKIGLIFNPREQNSNAQIQKMEEMAKKMGFEVVPLRIKPEKSDLENIIKQIEEKKVDIDCVYLQSESFLVSNDEWVVKRLNKAKIPTIAAIEQFMSKGALMGTVSSYYKLGQLVARAVAEDLKSNKSTINIPVILDPNPEFIINSQTAKLLNINISGKAAKDAKIIQ